MEKERLFELQKTMIVFTVIVVFFILGIKLANNMKNSAQSNNEPYVLFSQDKEKDATSNNKYIVAYQSKGVDALGGVIEDQIVLSVSSMSGPANSMILIKLNAVSTTAKKELEKPVISLPQLIYSSIQYVAEDMARLKTVKNEKEFSKVMKSYYQSIEEANDMVSLHGFEIEKESYVFEGGKIVKK